MKDARGIPVDVGDTVVFHQKTRNEIHYSWGLISWGKIVKINEKYIRVKDYNDKEFSKAPHNVVVAELPKEMS